MAIKDYFKKNETFNSIFNIDRSVPEEGDVTKKIKIPKTLYRTRQDLATWRSATQAAESLTHPNRTQLYRLYKDVDLDAHLTAVVQTRKNAILGAEFVVIDKDGNEDEEKTALINKKWFRDFTSYSLDSIYWGYSLIQFGDLEKDEFKSVELVPRQHVKQELCLVVNNLSETEGVDYTDDPYDDWTIGVGEIRDLGLYLKASPHVLWKKNAMGSSADYLELYGTPIRVLKTNVRDNTTRTNGEGMMREMGSNAWAVIDKNDEIELLNGQASGGNEEMFDTPIKRANSELSKLVLSQTGTTDEKSFSGSANVHERVLEQVVDADTTFIEDVYSDKLVPLLNKHGLGFEDRRIIIRNDDKLELESKAEIDLKLLEHYDIDADYIEKEYGTPVEEKQPESGSAQDIQNRVNKLYGGAKA